MAGLTASRRNSSTPYTHIGRALFRNTRQKVDSASCVGRRSCGTFAEVTMVRSFRACCPSIGRAVCLVLALGGPVPGEVWYGQNCQRVCVPRVPGFASGNPGRGGQGTQLMLLK